MAKVTFDFNDSNAELSGYKIGGRDIEAIRVKGASDAIAREAQANIGLLADRLQRGEIDAAEFYSAMQREVKFVHMTEYALARGGIDRVIPDDWARCQDIIDRQFGGVEGRFPGLRAFAEDVANGRYGNAGELQEQVLDRAGMYASAGRGTYENERVELAKENGRTRAMRIAGAADHCDVCSAEDGIERDIDDVVAIGDSGCGARCCCVIVSFKGDE